MVIQLMWYYDVSHDLDARQVDRKVKGNNIIIYEIGQTFHKLLWLFETTFVNWQMVLCILNLFFISTPVFWLTQV